MPRPLAVALEIVVTLISLAIIFYGLWLVLKRTEDPARLLFKWVLTAILTAGLFFGAKWLGPNNQAFVMMPVLCLIYGIVMTIMWGRQLISLFASPLTSAFDGGYEEVEPQPLYSMAQNKIKRGQFQEAIYDIKEQLMKFPNDFAGQRLLAEVQAQHLNDLAGAQITIGKLCAQPGHDPNSIASALNELADWQLKYGQDVDAARATLEQIIQRFANSEFAQHAEQRIAHLSSTDSLLAAHDRPAIRLRAGVQNLGLLKDSPPPPAEEDPMVRARRYVEHLEKHPHDNETREKLAWIYAEHYQRVDLAADQLEQILSQLNQSSRYVVHCLNIIADIQVEFGNNYEAARDALQRIVDLYPNSAAAESARNRIDRLKLELRPHRESESIKLGTYEQNIGIKKGAPKM